MMRFAMTLAALIAAAPAAQAAQPAPDTPLELWRLDCGSIEIGDLGVFSDTGMFAGERRTLASSCYLVRHGDRYLLWDTGLDGALAGQPRDDNGSKLDRRIVDQLGDLGLTAADIDYVGVSHYHYDHSGQVRDFAGATLLEGKADWAVIEQWAAAQPRYRPWLSGGATKQLVEGDHDVFGDGRVVMLDLPGHTEGHHALLVRLDSGPVILSGDQYHFTENRGERGVPTFNTSRAQTLASHDRIERLARNLRAKLVIQHEPDDIAKLPAFPASAK